MRPEKNHATLKHNLKSKNYFQKSMAPPPLPPPPPQ